MAQEVKPRIVRADDFVAEQLEEIAGRLPPSEKAQAEYLRGAAKRFRDSERTGMVRIWERSEGGADFIKPDPASQP